MPMKTSTIFWIIFWLALGVAMFISWRTHGNTSLNTVSEEHPIDCSQYGTLALDRDASWCDQQRELQNYPISEQAPVSSGCSVHCGDGQACGNSCISWNDTCHQPSGSACN